MGLVTVHFWLAYAAGGWKMPQIDNDGPDFLVAKGSFRSGHARRPDAVIYHPLQLTIGVTLNLHGGQRWNWRRHPVSKWHSRVLSIHSVTSDAIVRERLFSVRECLRRCAKGIPHLSVPHEDVVLRSPQHFALKPAGLCCFHSVHQNPQWRKTKPQDEGQ